MSDHKYIVKTGYPNFWNHLVDAVKFKDDISVQEGINADNAHVDVKFRMKEPIKRAECSNCGSHLGHVYDDGPAPFFKRITVNSASLNFHLKPWFDYPKLTFE